MFFRKFIHYFISFSVFHNSARLQVAHLVILTDATASSTPCVLRDSSIADERSNAMVCTIY